MNKRIREVLTLGSPISIVLLFKKKVIGHFWIGHWPILT